MPDSAPPDRRLLRTIVERRFGMAQVVDVVVLAASVAVVLSARYEFELHVPDWGRGAAFVVAASGVHLSLGSILGLYRGVTRFGSFDEVAVLGSTVGAGAVISALANRFLLDRLVPVSVSVVYAFVAIVAMAGARYAWRVLVRRNRRPVTAAPVVVYGAGEAGARLVEGMSTSPDSPYLPVAFVDDDPRRLGSRIGDVRVRGSLEALGRVARDAGADTVIVAIPSAGRSVLHRASEIAAEAGLTVLTLPPIDTLLSGRVAVGAVRPLAPEDLLGRDPRDSDPAAVAGYLTGRRVLITGAGGSIGSELARQVHAFDPAALVLVDHDESLLHQAQLSIDGRGLLDSSSLVVADIRDRDRMLEVFSTWRPEVVFHAAALKHVPLLEMHPDEAHKTNVEGTQHVLDAAASVGTERFVNISTDKAADPANVLGRTKREAERRTALVGRSVEGTYMSVRFGNVLGSRGSVLTAFRNQIERGGPVTVTDEEVTRYFMTITEAVHLVVHAGALGAPGEVLVLDMGEPVRIVDVARRMIDAAGGGIEIEVTGLRQGEKLHEVLLAENESAVPGPHPAISHVRRADDPSPDVASGAPDDGVGCPRVTPPRT